MPTHLYLIQLPNTLVSEKLSSKLMANFNGEFIIAAPSQSTGMNVLAPDFESPSPKGHMEKIYIRIFISHLFALKING